MANTKSAKKRARQTPIRTARNTSVRSRVKTVIREAREAIQAKGKGLSDSVNTAVSQLAKAAKKGVIHKRTAARKISRIKKAAASVVTAVKK